MSHDIDEITISFNNWESTSYGMSLIERFTEHAQRYSSLVQIVINPKVNHDDDVEIGWSLKVEPDMYVFLEGTIRDILEAKLIKSQNALKVAYEEPAPAVVGN